MANGDKVQRILRSYVDFNQHIFCQEGVFPVRLGVTETDGAIEVVADLPGMDQGDVDVTLSDGTLRINGRRETEKEERDRDYYHHERKSGTCNRWVTLLCEVDEEKIEAKFKNGILTVTLPMSQAIKEHERKIDERAA